MSDISLVTSEQIESALHLLGVNFIFGEPHDDGLLHKQPSHLIAILAQSREARLRLSLIPLFLEHPEFSHDAEAALQDLGESAKITLECYYTAALILQRKYGTALSLLVGKKRSLPDLFSEILRLQWTTDPEQDLQLLAKQHEVLSGMRINWLGTYEHAIQIWIHSLLIQKS